MSTMKAVYTVVDRGEGKKPWWCRIGTAFINKDGSLSVLLDALPTNGKMQIRDEEPREDRQEPPRRQDSRWGKSGAGNVAKHTAPADDSAPDDDSDIPF